MLSLRGFVMRSLAIVLLGIVLGICVGGVLGRLAMAGLAGLNPDAAGLTSDDGFVMGQFTVSGSLSLLGVGAFLGGLGGLVLVVVRPLLLGNRWWRAALTALGAGVPSGDLIVHTDGVDFTILEPVALSIALFVLLPALYGALLSLVVDRWWPPQPTRGGSVPFVLSWLGRGAALVVGTLFLIDLVQKSADLL